MERLMRTVQQRIGLLISLIGLITVITNLLNGIKTTGFAESFLDLSVLFLLIMVIPFIFSIFFEHRFFKIYQASAFFLSGSLNVIEAYEQFYGPGLFMAGWLLLRHYGFLENHKILKNAVIITTLVALSQVSAFLHTDEGFYAGFSTLWYALFLSLLVVIIWRDMVRQQEDLKNENRKLHTNYHVLKAHLKKIEEEQKPFDLKSYRISPAEERVLKTLTVYRASNREIAERLSLSESTVKLHLYNCCNKLGVDNRFAIIDLCKYNF